MINSCECGCCSLSWVLQSTFRKRHDILSNSIKNREELGQDLGRRGGHRRRRLSSSKPRPILQIGNLLKMFNVVQKMERCPILLENDWRRTFLGLIAPQMQTLSVLTLRHTSIVHSSLKLKLSAKLSPSNIYWTPKQNWKRKLLSCGLKCVITWSRKAFSCIFFQIMLQTFQGKSFLP